MYCKKIFLLMKIIPPQYIANLIVSGMGLNYRHL